MMETQGNSSGDVQVLIKPMMVIFFDFRLLQDRELEIYAPL